ncbi:TetR family transcriptional regulator [Mycobacterium intermedium]|uniref:TetR family transcriptional regulator n=1 Tax=Mycobacterium intermedium TaxID=28445 RepID=A0A1E3SN36_MYCIE|nr:TetR/AcrR family transcriptional regulator [Mycobacterium intermedium]MCV6963579.1 TetR/AcrR family transcriptional regulator [Mycobacterium intermedium]ODR02938.1 TetR family transcriptional regulator [Mycobacterium intermedium]ORB09590.1 TetR family transcriptional regulator [Mycobacterium intermedium]
MTAEGRREQILDVTHAIVDAEGFHAATPARIAQEAGINRSLIYQLFGDLPALFVALIDREAACAGAQFAEAIEGLGEPSADNQPLVRAFDGVLAAIEAHTATWRLFLFPPQGAPPQLHTRLAQSKDLVCEFLRSELLRIYPQLHDPDYTARILYASGLELLQLRLSDPETATLERLRNFVHRIGPELTGRPSKAQ